MFVASAEVVLAFAAVVLVFAAIVDDGGEDTGGLRSPDWVTDLKVEDVGKCTA